MGDGGWAAMAPWYDRRQGDSGDPWHRYLIDPGLISLVGRVRGLRLLDVACGNGYLARRFARAGAAKVVGIDASRPIIDRARARERARPLGVRYEVRDAANLEGLGSGSFDLVYSNIALMDIEDAAGAIREVGRVARDGGRFVFSICHPCFDLDDRSMWVVERSMFRNTVWRKVSGYREERSQWSPWRVSDGVTYETKGYHRTLSTYSRYLYDAGFAISRMEEPVPQPGLYGRSPQAEMIAEIPLHLVVDAVKIARASSRESRTWGRTSRRGVRRSGSRGRTRGIGSGRQGSIPGS
jgi:ubiquinone/menaquinone biosynthesis C-methylase UbiE